MAELEAKQSLRRVLAGAQSGMNCVKSASPLSALFTFSCDTTRADLRNLSGRLCDQIYQRAYVTQSEVL